MFLLIVVILVIIVVGLFIVKGTEPKIDKSPIKTVRNFQGVNKQEPEDRYQSVTKSIEKTQDSKII